jgi:hypothetical protein
MYTVYKIINKLISKFYVGVHKTEIGLDLYYGSGKIIIQSIIKYGKENFKKVILDAFDNKEEAFNLERLIVNKDLISNPNCYNIKLGGLGGWDHCNDKDIRSKISETKIKLYGSVNAPMMTKESRIKAHESIIRKYGSYDFLWKDIDKDSKLEKMYSTNLKRYGNKVGNLNSNESIQKSIETRRKLYGNANSLMMTKESRLKAVESSNKTKLTKAFNNTPELNIKCKLLLEEKTVISGNVYEVLVHMYGKTYAIRERYNIINKLGENKKFTQGKWKGHQVINLESSTTSA